MTESVAGEGSPGPSVPCRTIVMSDVHLGEGRSIRLASRQSMLVRASRAWRKWRGLPRAPLCEEWIDNPLEDAPDDTLFTRFFAWIRATSRPQERTRLFLMGDVFDFLAVRWRGKFADPPFEDVAVGKMLVIMRAHAAVFDGLETLVESGVELVVFAGNHDQHICWTGVQRVIVARIAGRDQALAARISFVDHRHGFHLVSDGVAYDHGMNMEAHNSVDPEQAIIDRRFGIKLPRPSLNHPYGSLMAVWLYNRLKWKTPILGRVNKVINIWMNAVLRDWTFAINALVLTIGCFLYFQFFAFMALRRKTSLWTTLRIAFSTLTGYRDDAYAKRLCEETGADLAVLGHIHEAKRRGSYINTGTWALLHELIAPVLELAWGRFRWIERSWRTLQHFLRTKELQFTTQLTKFLAASAFIAAVAVFLLVTVPKSWAIGAFHLRDLKPFALIAGAFVLCTGLLRLVSRRPVIREFVRPTFALIRRREDGERTAQLLSFDPESGSCAEIF